MAKVIAFVNNGFPLALHCGVTVKGEPAELEVNDYQAECLRGDCRITTLSAKEAAARKGIDKLEAEELEAQKRADDDARAAEAKVKADRKAAALKKQEELNAELEEHSKSTEKVAAKARLTRDKARARGKKSRGDAKTVAK